MKKRLLALTLVLGLLASPAALAAEGEETRIQEISPWAYDTVADSYAMGLLDDFYSTYLLDPVTDEQLEHMTGIVADKLALLGLPARAAGESGTPVVIDTTRGGVLNALYQEAAAYAFSGVEAVSYTHLDVYKRQAHRLCPLGAVVEQLQGGTLYRRGERGRTQTHRRDAGGAGKRPHCGQCTSAAGAVHCQKAIRL